MAEYGSILTWLEENAGTYTEIADKIWDFAEIALEERKSAAIQIEHLESQGFAIKRNIAGMETAFSAERGKGKPVLGFIGEYDALPGLSQKIQPHKEALIEGAPGHGCGHNLLGTGGMAAAVAVYRWLEEKGIEGTVRYYGCPAEEQLWGKAFMAREGAFDDLDAAFNFHPATYNMPGKGSAVGVYDVRFPFRGKTAHAGGAPHRGRSALDAVELMNVGVNYLREHVPEKVRMHYAITDGGRVPNIVPETAEVWYYLRAPDMKVLEDVYNRVCKIADGAALMTGTTVNPKLTAGCSTVLNNHYLSDLHYEVMKEIGTIIYTDEEKAFAAEINNEFPGDLGAELFDGYPMSEEERERLDAVRERPLVDENFPGLDAMDIRTGATDVGDVSLITPLSMLRTTCFPIGAASHSWAVTAAAGMSIGHKGMMHAAKIMACTAALLFLDPDHVKNAREEFLRRTGGAPYKCPAPSEVNIAEISATD